MRRQLLFLLFILFDVQNTKSEEDVHYLENAMWDLKNRLSTINPKRRIDLFRLKPSETSIIKDTNNLNVPMLSLTKSELSALYEAALKKEVAPSGSKTQTHQLPYAQTLLHEIQDITDIDKPSETENTDQNEDQDGYYYYYYPINSFMDGSNQPETQTHPTVTHSSEESPHAQYHSHHHEHKVHFVPAKAEKKKLLEPLFMAVSSFIGMAVMFVLSILFLPKFGGLKSRGVKPSSAGEYSSFAQIVFRAIEGDDCSERIACELGKTAKALKVYNNRFVKLFRRISPAYVGWYIDGVTKYAQTNLTCAAIKCRRKTGPKFKHQRKH